MNALAIMAHPADAEQFVGGTAALLVRKGWNVHFVTLTSGECGSQTLSAAEIRRQRKTEARAAAALLRVAYHSLDIRDGCIQVDLSTTQKIVAFIRDIRPQIIFTHPVEDYMADHTHTAQLVRWAVAESRHPNFPLSHAIPALQERPDVYHVDPEMLLGADGQIVPATTIVDITDVIDVKLEAFRTHQSQQKPATASRLSTLAQVERCAVTRGHQIGVKYGEGFCQLLFNGYRRANPLHDIFSGNGSYPLTETE